MCDDGVFGHEGVSGELGSLVLELRLHAAAEGCAESAAAAAAIHREAHHGDAQGLTDLLERVAAPGGGFPRRARALAGGILRDGALVFGDDDDDDADDDDDDGLRELARRVAAARVDPSAARDDDEEVFDLVRCFREAVAEAASSPAADLDRLWGEVDGLLGAYLSGGAAGPAVSAEIEERVRALWAEADREAEVMFFESAVEDYASTRGAVGALAPGLLREQDDPTAELERAVAQGEVSPRDGLRAVEELCEQLEAALDAEPPELEELLLSALYVVALGRACDGEPEAPAWLAAGEVRIPDGWHAYRFRRARALTLGEVADKLAADQAALGAAAARLHLERPDVFPGGDRSMTALDYYRELRLTAGLGAEGAAMPEALLGALACDALRAAAAREASVPHTSPEYMDEADSQRARAVRARRAREESRL